MKRFIALSLLLLSLQSNVLAGDGEKSQFLFSDWDGPDMRVFVTHPRGLEPDRPVVFVMHGMLRNADEYRDQWHDLAISHDFLLVVPEFSEENFPDSEGYNLGKLLDSKGGAMPREQWSFSAVEPVFDGVRSRFGMTAAGYSIYGHSAGGQFVHRFLFHVPEARVNRAVAANAGWYTMPDFAVDYPYGLKGSAVTEAGLQNALTMPLTLLLGDRDIDPEHESLRRTPEAMVQGKYRMERGFSFFDAGREAAVRLGVPFNWHLSTVIGADHDNRLMAPAAARLLLAD